MSRPDAQLDPRLGRERRLSHRVAAQRLPRPSTPTSDDLRLLSESESRDRLGTTKSTKEVADEHGRDDGRDVRVARARVRGPEPGAGVLYTAVRMEHGGLQARRGRLHDDLVGRTEPRRLQ